MNSITDTLFKITRDVCDQNKKSQIAAAVIRRGKIVSFGNNDYSKSHPFQKQYASHDHCIFWHAETNAIFNALKEMDDISGCDLYVVRGKKMKVNGKDFPVSGMAMPCPGCMKAIKKYGISRVIYSIDGTLKNRIQMKCMEIENANTIYD
jgi:deoxycytidylate deaminase